MSIPSTLITGTIAYLVLGAAMLASVFGMRVVGKLNKDDAATGNVVVVTAVVAMWIFWVCAWMHQWHPLIKPIYEA